jgi:protein-arginine kinase activator protein McsA
LEVIYSPQRIHVIGNTEKNDLAKDESDVSRLETMLKKAIDTENFELATKIKDLLALQNGEATEDK